MVQIKRNLPKGNTSTLIILHDRRSSQFVSGLDHFRVLDYFGNAVDFETVASMNENTKVNYQITLSEAIDDFFYNYHGHVKPISSRVAWLGLQKIIAYFCFF